MFQATATEDASRWWKKRLLVEARALDVERDCEREVAERRQARDCACQGRLRAGPPGEEHNPRGEPQRGSDPVEIVPRVCGEPQHRSNVQNAERTGLGADQRLCDIRARHWLRIPVKPITLSGQSITCRSGPGALQATALSLPAFHDRRSRLLVVWSINQGNPTPETACRSGRKGLLPLAYLSWSQSTGPQEGEAVLGPPRRRCYVEKRMAFKSPRERMEFVMVSCGRSGSAAP